MSILLRRILRIIGLSGVIVGEIARLRSSLDVERAHLDTASGTDLPSWPPRAVLGDSLIAAEQAKPDATNAGADAGDVLAPDRAARFAERRGALCIDLCIAYVFTVLLSFALVPSLDPESAQSPDPGQGVGLFSSFLGGPLFLFIVGTIGEWRWGATPGKLIARLRVERADGAGVPLVRALARNLVESLLVSMFFFVLLPLFLIDAIVARGGNRYLHDAFGGTRVVARGAG